MGIISKHIYNHIVDAKKRMVYDLDWQNIAQSPKRTLGLIPYLLALQKIIRTVPSGKLHSYFKWVTYSWFAY